MKRRRFIAGVLAAAAAPPAAHAQRPMPLIGMLHGGPAEAFEPLSSSFRQGLSEDGFVEGKNVAFEYRWAQGQSSDFLG